MSAAEIQRDVGSLLTDEGEVITGQTHLVVDGGQTLPASVSAV